MIHVKRLCAVDKDQSLLPDNDPQMMEAENRGIYPSFQFPQQPVVMMPGHQVGDKQEVETQGGNGRKWEEMGEGERECLKGLFLFAK